MIRTFSDNDLILTYGVKSKALVKSKVRLLEKPEPVPEPPEEEPSVEKKKRPMQIRPRDHMGQRTAG